MGNWRARICSQCKQPRMTKKFGGRCNECIAKNSGETMKKVFKQGVIKDGDKDESKRKTVNEVRTQKKR